MAEWLTKLGPFTVEKMPVPRGSGKVIQRNMTHAGVLHTAEGNSVSGMVNTLKAKGGAAYSFAAASGGRIIQLRALNDQSSALRGDQNRFAQVQIVMVNSVPAQPDMWIPEDSLLEPLLHLLKYFSQAPESIPLIEPVATWPSDWSDFKGQSWAVNNHRRKQAGTPGRWPHAPGWFTHVEIPNQGPTWHHDCYALNRKRILELAAALRTVEVVFAGQASPTPEKPSTGERAAGMLAFDPIPFAFNVRVLAIQQRLGNTGPELDGKWGKNTQARLSRFQHGANLPETGKPDQLTLDKLFA